jgi:hypothetical protein
LLGDGSYLAKSANGPDRATIFLMEHSTDGWKKRPITARGFSTCGFSGGQNVKVVPQATLDQASPGALIDFLSPLPQVRQVLVQNAVFSSGFWIISDLPK